MCVLNDSTLEYFLVVFDMSNWWREDCPDIKAYCLNIYVGTWFKYY